MQTNTKYYHLMENHYILSWNISSEKIIYFTQSVLPNVRVTCPVLFLSYFS